MAYDLGQVQSIPANEDASESANVAEPHGVYRLADGRLVLSRGCG